MDTAEGDTTVTVLLVEPGVVFTMAVAPIGCEKQVGMT